MKAEKVTEFVKNHKKEFILATVAIVGGVVALVITRNNPEIIRETEKERIKALDWKVGDLTDLWDEGEFTNAIITNAAVDDIGKLGQEIIEKLDGYTNESRVDMAFSLTSKEET